MYKVVTSKSNPDDLYTINITMVIEPMFYENSQVFAALLYDLKNKSKPYRTTVNPSRIINGPLSRFGEEIQSPIKEEYEEFIQDCRDLIIDCGFTIIQQTRSQDSNKSEYFIIFGINDRPYGRLVYNFRVSDHPFEGLSFHEEDKSKVIEYMDMNNILNGEATEAGIGFSIKQVLVGSVPDDTWDRALNRAYIQLKRMKNRIIRKMNEEK